MLMTVMHRARHRPRSHSPVVRWIRNPLSSDSGVRIPLSAPQDPIHRRKRLIQSHFLLTIRKGVRNGGVGDQNPLFGISGVKRVRTLHQLRDVILNHARRTGFEQGAKVLIDVWQGSHPKRKGVVQHVSQALSRTRVLALSNRGGYRE